MDVNLVFEGGGVLGIYYVGVYKALREYGYSAKSCAGTSAGSLISAVIAAGYSDAELEDIIFETDFKRFNKDTSIGWLPLIGKPLSLFLKKGMYDYRGIEEWIGDILKQKGVTNFYDLMKDGKSRLKVIAADITRSKMLILPDNLREYDINPSGFSVAKAVAMSCAIPYYFAPVILKAQGKSFYIVDGGILSGYPIWIFDDEVPYTPTIGIKIKDLASNTSQGKTDIISYTGDIINAPINEDESNFVRHADLVRTIVIDYNGEVSATDFNKVDEKVKKELIQKGYDCSRRFLEKFNK